MNLFLYFILTTLDNAYIGRVTYCLFSKNNCYFIFIFEAKFSRGNFEIMSILMLAQTSDKINEL